MSTSKQIALFSALAFSAVALNASAGVGKGDFEAGASLSISKNSRTTDVEVCTGFGCSTTESTTDTKTGTISASVGYFILDFLEIKGSVSETVTDTTNSGILSPGADFVFLGQNSVAPFVGLSYGLAIGDVVGTVDSDFIDVHGGIKFFFAERASFELKLTRFEPVDSQATSARWDLAAGINVYF